MSYEGRVQKLCRECNYYEEQNCYCETDHCPVCSQAWSISNSVDDTNGEEEGYDFGMVPESHIPNFSFYLSGPIDEKLTAMAQALKDLADALESYDFGPGTIGHDTLKKHENIIAEIRQK